MSEFLVVDGVAKSYLAGGRVLPILRGVSLSVKEGEILAIVGPSGAGKSTLLHLMGFLDRPTAGDVRFRGQSLSGLGGAAQDRVRNERFGFVFQMHHLLPELSALENAVLPLMIRHGIGAWLGGGLAARRKARDLLEKLGLRERVHHRPSQLSGGERQRVALARALVGDPEVVFCDEPTGSLDAATAAEIRDLIVALSRETRKTFVLVTHDPKVAGLAERTVRIEDGLLVQSP